MRDTGISVAAAVEELRRVRLNALTAIGWDHLHRRLEPLPSDMTCTACNYGWFFLRRSAARREMSSAVTRSSSQAR